MNYNIINEYDISKNYTAYMHYKDKIYIPCCNLFDKLF